MQFITRHLKKYVTHLWSVFYVRNEWTEKTHASKWGLMWAIFLMYVDAAQVIRVMMQPGYGWSIAVYQYVRMFDVFALVQVALGAMLSQVIPSGSVPSPVYFGFAVVVISIAIIDIFYVMRLFASGHVEEMWPVYLLNVMIEVLVTTGFNTVFEWALLPIRCTIMDDGTALTSISQYLKGPGAPCTPFDMPEILITLPTLLLLAGYVVFATISALHSFCLNPLSRHARATANGRLEYYYCLARVVAALGVYVTQYTSPLGTNTVLAIIFLWLFLMHRAFLPFNNHVVNLAKGGFLLTMVWVAGASVVLYAFSMSMGSMPSSAAPGSLQVSLMWTIFGLCPISFAFGVSMISTKHKMLYQIMVNLYGEYQAEQRAVLQELQEMHSSHLEGKSISMVGSMRSNSAHEPAALKMSKKSQFESFFDRHAEERIAFRTWEECSATVRTFLFRRSDMDLKFINFIIKKGMQEHPMSDGLVILHIQMLRFVFRNPLQAAAQEKIFRVGGKVAHFDSQYTLYALERKLFQERACSDLGQDAVRAIDLMEFNLGMQTARAAQLAAVTSVKMFWRHLSKRNHKGHIADELMTRLETYDAAAAKAKEEYSWMLEKYSNSAQLMREWATFCDTVLNDEKMATEARVQAVSLENEMNEVQEDQEADIQIEREDGITSERGGAAPSHGGGSSLSEATETKRTTVQRFFAKITQTILGREKLALDQFHQRIGLFVLTLLVVETVAFVFAVVFVFSDVATLDIHMIAFISLFRSHVATCGFYQRSSMLAAWRGDQDLLAKRSQAIVDLARQVEVEHWNLYQAAEGGMKTHLDSIKFAVQIPAGQGWVQDEFVYFDLIFDYVRRIRASAKTTMQDFRDTQMAIGKISQAKSEVVYVQENLFRSVSEVFESLLQLYDNQLEAFISLATTLVIIISALAAAIVLIFGYFLLSGLLRTVQTVQYKLVVISMGLTLPRATAKKMYKHFQQIEFRLKSVDDENLERRGLADDMQYDENQDEEAVEAEQEVFEELVEAAHAENAGHFAEFVEDHVENSPPESPQLVPKVTSAAEHHDSAENVPPRAAEGAGMVAVLNEENLRIHISTFEAAKKSPGIPNMYAAPGDPRSHPQIPSTPYHQFSSPYSQNPYGYAPYQMGYYATPPEGRAFPPTGFSMPQSAMSQRPWGLAEPHSHSAPPNNMHAQPIWMLPPAHSPHHMNGLMGMHHPYGGSAPPMWEAQGGWSHLEENPWGSPAWGQALETANRWKTSSPGMIPREPPVSADLTFAPAEVGTPASNLKSALRSTLRTRTSVLRDQGSQGSSHESSADRHGESHSRPKSVHRSAGGEIAALRAMVTDVEVSIGRPMGETSNRAVDERSVRISSVGGGLRSPITRRNRLRSRTSPQRVTFSDDVSRRNSSAGGSRSTSRSPSPRSRSSEPLTALGATPPYTSRLRSSAAQSSPSIHLPPSQAGVRPGPPKHGQTTESMRHVNHGDVHPHTFPPMGGVRPDAGEHTFMDLYARQGTSENVRVENLRLGDSDQTDDLRSVSSQNDQNLILSSSDSDKQLREGADYAQRASSAVLHRNEGSSSPPSLKGKAGPEQEASSAKPDIGNPSSLKPNTAIDQQGANGQNKHGRTPQGDGLLRGLPAHADSIDLYGTSKSRGKGDGEAEAECTEASNENAQYGKERQQTVDVEQEEESDDHDEESDEDDSNDDSDDDDEGDSNEADHKKDFQENLNLEGATNGHDRQEQLPEYEEPVPLMSEQVTGEEAERNTDNADVGRQSDDDEVSDSAAQADQRSERARPRMRRQSTLIAMLKAKNVPALAEEAQVKVSLFMRLVRGSNLGHQEGLRTLYSLIEVLLPGDAAAEDVKGALVQSVLDRRTWHQNFNVYSFVLLIILGLSVFCSVFPVEKVASFVNSASTLNHASRRRYLIKNIVHLTREMVLDDGFSRFEKKQSTAAISYYQEQFTRSDLAVRKGGVFGIRTGADDRNPLHNQIMYTNGCPWRDDPSDCLIPSLPGMGQTGLYQILSAFMDSVRKAVVNYGSPPEEWPDDWTGQSGVMNKFQNVTLDFNKLAYFDSDLKLQFVMDSFEGDVAQGLGLISDILEDEAFESLKSGVRDNNTLYAVHITCVIIIFYFGLFRHTMHMAHFEIRRARSFVVGMPFYILNPAEVESVVDFFKKGQDHHDHDDDRLHDDEDARVDIPIAALQMDQDSVPAEEIRNAPDGDDVSRADEKEEDGASVQGSASRALPTVKRVLCDPPAATEREGSDAVKDESGTEKASFDNRALQTNQSNPLEVDSSTIESYQEANAANSLTIHKSKGPSFVEKKDGLMGKTDDIGSIDLRGNPAPKSGGSKRDRSPVKSVGQSSVESLKKQQGCGSGESSPMASVKKQEGRGF